MFVCPQRLIKCPANRKPGQRSVGRACVMTALAASMAAAHGQSATAPEPEKVKDVATPAQKAKDASTSQLDAVTISATRRKELVRDVPVSITTISTDAQAALGAKDLTDVLQNVPGVSYDNYLGRPGHGDIVIRGVTTGVPTNSTVATYVDDVPIGSSTGITGGTSAFDQRLLDLSNIEILKGPQGTLYGASAMGGLLRYNTSLPDYSYFSGSGGGELSSTAHGGTNYTVYGNVNVPLSQNAVAIRGAVFYSKDGGFTDALGPGAGNNVNSASTTGGRLSMGARPTKDVEIRLAAQSQYAKANGLGSASYTIDGQPLGDPRTNTYLYYSQPTTTRDDLYTGTIEANLGWGRAYSITGFQTHALKHNTDYNAGYLNALPPFLGVTETFDHVDEYYRKLTQELRLVSSGAGPVQWLAGLFYTSERARQYETTTATLAPTSPFPPGVPLYDAAGPLVDWKEYAAYGTVSWDVTKDLSLTGGIRFSHNKQDVVTRNFGVLADNTLVYGSSSESPTTYLGTARYKLTSQSSVYARAASGYRAGGPNAPATNLQTGTSFLPPPYASDKLWNYEVGYKSDLPDQLGSFEAALYQINWRNIQELIFNNGTQYTGNGGSARIRGIDSGGTLRPVRDVTLRAAFTYLDAKLTADSPGLGAKDGDRLPTTPRFAATLGGRYEFAVAGSNAFAGLNASYTGERNTSFVNATGIRNYKLPSYTTLDFTSGFTVGRVDVGFYVRNLTDKLGQLQAYTAFVPVGGPVLVNFIRPRTIGVTAVASF